ncbi:hypothetical protein P154DRAFT_244449 [Amniculicola lignicola CBS 123094]|uniref:Uncharacterized protein n=1 Tax=Amniculicola lignicola CBS 123094 TaxID=1392246 RepID=A0A6A5WA66_9PLEO|nr:hypothetical protein P154DRAFT_244449 [Amniculicola lignicola CBS 123094]
MRSCIIQWSYQASCMRFLTHSPLRLEDGLKSNAIAQCVRNAWRRSASEDQTWHSDIRRHLSKISDPVTSSCPIAQGSREEGPLGSTSNCPYARPPWKILTIVTFAREMQGAQGLATRGKPRSYTPRSLFRRMMAVRSSQNETRCHLQLTLNIYSPLSCGAAERLDLII